MTLNMKKKRNEIKCWEIKLKENKKNQENGYHI